MPIRPSDIRSALSRPPVDDTTARHRLLFAAWRAGAELDWLMRVPSTAVAVEDGHVVITHAGERIALAGSTDPLGDPVRIADAWLEAELQRPYAFRVGDQRTAIEYARRAWRLAARRVRTVNLGGQDLRQLPPEHARLVSGAIGYRSVAWVRDRALLLTGWRGGLRPVELSNTNREHFQPHDDLGMVLTLPKSKTDQQGRGQRVALPEVDDVALCAPCAISDWLAYRGVEPGPMFCTLKGRRIKVDAIRKTVRRHFGDEYSGYSMRRGHATSATEAGATLLQTAVSLRHSTPQTTTNYVDSTDELDVVAGLFASFSGGRP